MPKFTQLMKVTLGAILFSFTTKIVLSHKVLANPNLELAEPACYMTRADGRTINLNQLCATTFREDSDSTNSLINLEQDTDKDGISDALVDEVKRIESAQDKTAAIKDFFNRLPFSPKTRELLTQAEALQQRLAQSKDKAEMQQIFGRLQYLKQQMMNDPNYVRVEQALR
jgi:hypothetical protein